MLTSLPAIYSRSIPRTDEMATTGSLNLLDLPAEIRQNVIEQLIPTVFLVDEHSHAQENLEAVRTTCTRLHDDVSKLPPLQDIQHVLMPPRDNCLSKEEDALNLPVAMLAIPPWLIPLIGKLKLHLRHANRGAFEDPIMMLQYTLLHLKDLLQGFKALRVIHLHTDFFQLVYRDPNEGLTCVPQTGIPMLLNELEISDWHITEGRSRIQFEFTAANILSGTVSRTAGQKTASSAADRQVSIVISAHY